MAKYYVTSGEINTVINAEHEFDAIGIAIATAPPGSMLGEIIWVNEQGFDLVEHQTDVFVDTKSFLRDVCGYDD